MARKFAEISYTPAVRAAQERYGSRRANMRFEEADEPEALLSETEIDFIEARDGFYQATANADGWPYVQFRGGPAGFLKVLDQRTIGYADFRGNVQYLSVGNLADNDRIALILMDYANQRRLKIWARARLVHANEDADLVARLEVPTYRARVERAVVLTIEAFDWNCPQHITPRFTEAEIEAAGLRLTATQTEPDAAIDAALGDGPLELVITGIRQLTPEVRAYELRRPGLGDLPAVEAGSHLQVPVRLDDGRLETRSYSIASNPGRRDAYEIAVRLDPEGSGGSSAVHAGYALGMRLNTGMPKNAFALHDDDRPAVLIAGGIGITPLKAMAQKLKSDGRAFRLHYAARTEALLAYRSKLALALAGDVTFYAGDGGPRLDVARVIAEAPVGARFYVCGPERLIEAVRQAAAEHGRDPCDVRFEHFKAPAPEDSDTAHRVELARSGITVDVARNQTILDAVLDAGIDADYACKTGTCGTCAVKVLTGAPDHRDQALSDAERDQASLMCPCVSRATTEDLVLDL